MLKNLAPAVLILLSTWKVQAQDVSKTAFIDSLISRYETDLAQKMKIVKDSTILGIADGSNERDTVIRHIEYYIDEKSGQVEKIVQTTIYKNRTTTFTIYYKDQKTIQFTENDRWLDTLEQDFVIYFFNDEAIYQQKRVGDSGVPHAPAFLQWSYQLLKSK